MASWLSCEMPEWHTTHMRKAQVQEEKEKESLKHVSSFGHEGKTKTTSPRRSTGSAAPGPRAAGDRQADPHVYGGCQGVPTLVLPEILP